MDKPRQRRYPVVHSNLNLLRETILYVSSIPLWLYCLFVIYITSMTLLNINTEFVQLARISMSISRTDYIDIFKPVFYFIIVIAIFFVVRFIQSFKEEKS